MEHTKNNIKTAAERIATGYGKQIWDMDVNLYAAAETLAKRYLTKDIKAMEKFMQEVEECAKKPITYGALKGSGFFYIHGDIRSPQWVQKQWAELHCMRARRLRLNNVAIIKATGGNI